MRAAIDDVDHALIELVAKRRSIVLALVSSKLGLGLPLVDPAREAALLADRRAFAGARGVPPDLAETLVLALLSDSHEQIRRLKAGAK